MKTVQLLSCFWIIKHIKQSNYNYLLYQVVIFDIIILAAWQRGKRTQLFFIWKINIKLRERRRGKERQLQRFLKPKVDVSIVLKYIKTYHIRDGKSLWTNSKTLESPRFGKDEKTFARKFHTEGSNSIPRASKGPQKAKRRLPRQGVQINSICIYAVSSHILVLIYIIQT